MVDIRDILIKAAEDVQSGMWCAGARYTKTRNPVTFAAEGHVSLDWEIPVTDLMNKYRCAEGSIDLATRLLGGTPADFFAAVDAVGAHVPNGSGLWGYNDIELSINRKLDPFEAGQQLAELFRFTAESL